MKTSKKLLSFFLAVVMVVTTCSVGFTAFAQDNKNSIWSASSEAEDAFNTLNGLADEFLPGALMGIDFVSKGVYEKYAKELGKDVNALTQAEKDDIAAKATLQDILAVLQPTLLNLLSGTSQNDYPGVVGTAAHGDGDYYSYLLKYITRYTTDENGDRVLEYLTYEKEEDGSYKLDEDGNKIEKYVANPADSEKILDEDSMSFFTLYAICKEYRNDRALSSDTRKVLNEWYDQLDTIANIALVDNTQDVVAKLGKDFNPSMPTDYTSQNLEMLEDFYTDEYMAGVDADDKSVLAAAYEKYTADLQKYSCDIVIDSLADLMYYGFGAGQHIKYLYAYYDLLQSVDVDIMVKGDYDFLNEGFSSSYDVQTAITPENYVDALAYDVAVAYLTSPGSDSHGVYATIADGVVTVTEEDGSHHVLTPENALYYIAYYWYWMQPTEFEIRGTRYGLERDFAKIIAEEVIDNYYTDIITALVVRYNDDVDSVNDFINILNDRLPKADEDGNIFTPDEINELTSFFKDKNNLKSTSTTEESNIYRFFKDGGYSYYNYLDINAAVPENIKNTPVSEYFALMFERNLANTYNTGLFTAFFSEFYSTTYPPYLLEDGTAVSSYNNANFDKVQRFEPSNLAKINYNDGATYSMDKINEYVADAVVYAYAKIGSELLGVDSLGYDSKHFTPNTIFDYKSYLDSQVAPEALKVTLTDEQLDILYGDYSLANEAGTEILNYILNTTIGIYFSDESPIAGIININELVTGILGSSVNLEAAIMDVWARLCNAPMGTVFELLPILVVLVDSFLLPLLANAEGDRFYNFLGGLLPVALPLLTTSAITTSDGSYIGLDKLGWDLNTLLPQLMDWLFDGKNAEGITYWDGRTQVLNEIVNDNGDYSIRQAVFTLENCGSIDFKHYNVADSNGNALTAEYDNNGDAVSYSYLGKTNASLPELLADYADTEFSCYMTYSSDVPYLTGIYIADKALKDAKISDIGSLLSKAMKNDTVGPILGEVVTELATLFRVSVKEFVNSDRVNQTRYTADGSQPVVSGLNNVLVALPQLFDIMEDLGAEKYGVAKDAWTYCYDGKIYTDDAGNTCNKVVEDIKAYADSNDPDRAVDILDWFADLFVGDWLNAIFSILNNVVSTENEISNNVPIVAGLLNALGGFGEESILTDIFNGVFQIDRTSKYSFTFEKQENGLTGLSKNHAYFLISNITTLIEVVTNLVGKFGGNDNADNNNNSNSSSNNNSNTESKVLATKAAKPSNADKNNYSDAELSNASDLINNVDKMISSLLADSTLNGFNLSKTDNILASVVTFFSNYMGNDCFTDIGKLLNSYTYYITGSETHTPDGKGNVDAKKVYTNETLTGLVVETFLLIENLVENLLADYGDVYTLDNGTKAQYNLLVEALEGLISPDAIGVRLDGYDKVQKKLADYNCWHNAAAQTSRGDYKIKLDWGIKAGDKDAFYDGLSASLRLITSILSVVLINTGWYETVVSPLLDAFCSKNGIKIDTPAQFAALKNGYHDEVLLGIIRPVSEWFNSFLAKPATTLIRSLQGLAGILDDKNGATIASILKGAITPLANEVNGLGNIMGLKSDKLGATSPTLKSLLGTVANMLLKFSNPSNLVPGVTISGANIIPIVNGLLDGYGITLRQFNWNKFSNLKSPAAALVYLLDYLFDVVLDNDNLSAIAKLIGNDTLTTIIDLIKELEITSKDLLAVLDRILEASDSPALAYWTFSRYLQEIKFDGFYYPAGVTADMANRGVEQLDQLVAGIFPLLSSFGVDLGDSLEDILDNKLFTNELITKAAAGIYGAIDGLDPTIKNVLKGLGLVSSTKDIAAILTDKSYGATYTDAANAIKSQSDWESVKKMNVNWGFTDGSDKAQQGFVNALAAVLRPMYTVLNAFLNEGALQLDDVAYDAICSINIPVKQEYIDISTDKNAPIRLRIEYAMSNGVLTVNFREDPKNRQLSRTSSLQLDFKSLKNLDDLKIMGTNGFNSFVIPLLEAFQCSDIQTYAQYQNAVANAKDNLLLGILNPLLGDTDSSFLNKLVASPVSELTKLLPNIAMYLEAHSLFQLIFNLLAPVTDILGLTGEAVIDVIDFLEEYLGMSMVELFNSLIDPLLGLILADTDIELSVPYIDPYALIGLGEEATYTSKATGADGNFLTGKMVDNVDQGKVLVTVLRFVANILVDNAGALKELIGSLGAIKNSDKADMIMSIINSVFNTIGNASADQIVAAVFYLLAGTPQNAFWDYTKYKTGTYTFTYPESVDTEFLKQLPPMLDGLIGGLADLNELIGNALFKDELITKLAKGLYGAIEGVKINDNLNLTQLLGQTDIDFSTENVAKLLVDEKYGQKFTSASATIAAAGSWKNVNENALKWGVTDRDSFFHALVAVLRPLYGVLDVLLNDAYLGLFDLVRIPGSNGYTSSIVPLMEAFSMYNVKTQYQYRQDINKEYDAILLDIINPLWDLVEDVLNAPLQTIAAIVPNLALFIGNNGLCQIFDNLLTPISALVDSIRPVVDLNDLLPTLFDALNVDLNGLLAKVGIKNFSLDLYDLNKTLMPVLGADAIIPLLNAVLGLIKVGGSPLGIKLNAVDWLQLASHGTTIVAASQAATYGSRVFVQGDSSETLIAVLRYLIETINAGDNFDKISSLIGGLLGDGSNESMTNMISQVLGMLQNDTDLVIADLVGLLETLA